MDKKNHPDFSDFRAFTHNVANLIKSPGLF